MADDTSSRSTPSNRPAWIIAGAIALAATVIVAVLLFVNAQANKRERCPELQEEALEALQRMDLPEMLELQGEWDDLECEGDFIDIGV